MVHLRPQLAAIRDVQERNRWGRLIPCRLWRDIGTPPSPSFLGALAQCVAYQQQRNARALSKKFAARSTVTAMRTHPMTFYCLMAVEAAKRLLAPRVIRVEVGAHRRSPSKSRQR